MISCSVCGAKNDDLAVTCSACKGYLQTKVDALNLFETLWRLIESPRQAFRRIVLSRHKNYVFLLSSLFGISLVFSYMWYENLGGRFANILTLVGTGIVLGSPVGVLVTGAASLILVVLMHVAGARVKLRNAFAVLAYAAAPVVFSLVFVFPIEIAGFGIDFFGQNPSPMVLKPVVYVFLIGFDALASVWYLILLAIGVRVLGSFGWGTGILVTLLLVIVGGGALAILH